MMSFIVAGCVLLLALLVEIGLAGGGRIKRDTTSSLPDAW
jgi:hypothetical protein